MTQRTHRAGAAPFAHLLGGFRAAKADEPADPKDKTAKGKKAADPKDENPSAEEPNTVEVTDENEGVDGDTPPDVEDVVDPDDSLDEEAVPEESDADPKVRKAVKAGRKAERARWALVMGHATTAGRVPSACQLLNTTTASARSVVGTLATLPAAQAPVAASGRSRLDERMAARPGPRVGADAPAAAAGNYGAATAAAMAKVRGSTR